MKRLILCVLVGVLGSACVSSSTGYTTPAASPTQPASEEKLASNEASDGTFKPPFKPPAGSIQLSHATCPENATHIYHPFRLYLLDGCKQHAIVGTLERAKPEADGDLHLWFLPDPGQVDPHGGFWINDMNVRGQHGYLVLEPVCEGTVTQADAVSACKGVTSPLKIPKQLPTRVSALGYWVFDADHGWNELHELTALGTISN